MGADLGAAALGTADRPAFLGVERSVRGNRWELAAADERAGLAISQGFGLPDIVGRLIAARGIPIDAVEDFLQPSLRRQLPDPSCLADMDAAAARLAAAVRNAETIGVFGDYDVDGATSSALLKRFLEAVGGRAEIYIPDRIREGYGPTLPGLQALERRGARLLVTVDCGITAFEPLASAAAAGIEVIVVDHHVAEPRLPAAVAVVNPNRLDDGSGQGQLAAVGVAYLLVVAVNRALRQAGWYGARPEPDLLQWLDLVALGTVCDVVPLTGVNRALVAQGLKVMARRGNHGLAALADVAGASEPPDAYHAGFILGPRVNAGGRVGECWLGAALLSTMDPAEASRHAAQLDAYNKDRREIESVCLEAAIEQIENGPTTGGLVYATCEGWHPGVIGIVAGRLRERYNRPACVVARENGIGKGSGRSVRGVDLGAAVLAARQAGLLINGGGHRMAAGFTVARESEDALRAFLAERVAADAGPDGIKPSLRLDGALQCAAATVPLLRTLDTLAPFGAGNPRPRFALPAARILKADVVGEHHVRCILGGEGQGRLKAIAFRAAGDALGAALLGARGVPVHLAGHLKLDRWQGREEAQLVIEDLAPVA